MLGSKIVADLKMKPPRVRTRDVLMQNLDESFKVRSQRASVRMCQDVNQAALLLVLFLVLVLVLVLSSHVLSCLGFFVSDNWPPRMLATSHKGWSTSCQWGCSRLPRRSRGAFFPSALRSTRRVTLCCRRHAHGTIRREVVDSPSSPCVAPNFDELIQEDAPQGPASPSPAVHAALTVP